MLSVALLAGLWSPLVAALKVAIIVNHPECISKTFSAEHFEVMICSLWPCLSRCGGCACCCCRRRAAVGMSHRCLQPLQHASIDHRHIDNALRSVLSGAWRSARGRRVDDHAATCTCHGVCHNPGRTVAAAAAAADADADADALPQAATQLRPLLHGMHVSR